MLSNLMVSGFLLANLIIIGGLPQDPDPLADTRLLMTEKKYLEAEEALQKIIEENPDDPKANYMSGLCLLELQRYQEAETRFSKLDSIIKDEAALEIVVEDPEYPRADQVLVGLARVYMGRSELAKAAETLDEAEKLKPDNPDLYYHRGQLEGLRKDYASAARNLEKSTELDPENAYAHYYAGLAYSQIKRPDKMVEHFRFFLKLAPEAPEAAKVRSLLRGIR